MTKGAFPMRAFTAIGRQGRWGAFALGLALGLGAGQARASDAAALEGQLHDWLAALLGPRAALGERPVRVTSGDGRFALEMPVTGPLGATGITLDGPAATATARPLGDGRWAVDDVKLPSPLRIAVPTAKGPGTWTVTLRDQDQHAVIDPTLATTSTWDGQVGGYSVQYAGPLGERRSEAAHIVAHVTWQPQGNGRVDVAETARSDLLSSNARMPKGKVASFSAAHSSFEMHADALAPERIGPLLRALLDAASPAIAATAGATQPDHRLPPQVRATLLALLDAASGLLDGFDETLKMQDVHLSGPMGNAALQDIESGTSVAAPEGRLRLRLRLALDGLSSEMLSQGPLAAYMPRHIVLAPELGGVPADRALALLKRALASDGNDPALAADAEALVRDGPLAIGLRTLAVDFGPATLAASGELRVLGRRDLSGHAHVQMTGLGALIREAQTVPMLQQAAPVLIFLKGIGDTEGSTTVWDIAYVDGRLTVNGTDMSQMLPPH
jgi:hypothetical protein